MYFFLLDTCEQIDSAALFSFSMFLCVPLKNALNQVLHEYEYAADIITFHIYILSNEIFIQIKC